MLYRQKFDTFIRIYDDIGYICSKKDYGDRVVDHAGAVFLAALSRSAQSIEELTATIAAKFADVDKDTLQRDVVEFYAMLEEDGFVVSGGEPMLHRHFIDYLRKAQEYDFSINVLSNLTLLNDDIVKAMKANRLSSVQVSLYSMKPEVHDAITMVKGSFYKTRDAILKLIDNDLPLQISCPTMKQNKIDFVDVINWAGEHKVRAITDYIMMARYDHTTGNLDNRLSLNEVEDVINGIVNNDEDYKNSLSEADFTTLSTRDDSEDIVCGICVSSICMVANGAVYPCAGWQDCVLGNLKEQSLRQIWENSPKVQKLRSIRKKDFPQCRQCEDRLFCAMCMVRSAKQMKDHQIHIGQFYERYYNPTDILRIVSEAGVEGCYYSSTSSCKEGVKLSAVEQEIIACAKQFSPDKMQPLLWFMPDYINQGLTVDKAFDNIPYRGIKLHPRFNRWDLNDSKQLDCLHSLFGFADAHHLPITIHTGEDEYEKPCFFEQFFDKYKNASIILAHCRPLDNAIAMFKKYPHLKGDTAFVPKENIQTIINSGFKERLLAGSDFPITHYFRAKYGEKDISLKAQYREDVLNFKLLEWSEIV